MNAIANVARINRALRARKVPEIRYKHPTQKKRARYWAVFTQGALAYLEGVLPERAPYAAVEPGSKPDPRVDRQNRLRAVWLEGWNWMAAYVAKHAKKEGAA